MQGVVSLVSVAILARILAPSDFGVFAMVLPVALIVGMTLNRGLHVAVMHEARLGHAGVSRLFWIAQRFNVLLLGGMALSAPLLAVFYREPRVTQVALVWTAALALQAIGAFPEALLKRDLRFGTLTVIEVGGMVIGVAAAIAAATLGWTNLALVLQVLVWNLIKCAGAIAAAGWIPTRSPGAAPDTDVDRLVAYGSQFGLARAVYWLGRQADRMVVGYVSGAAVVGLYDSARRWSWYPFQELFLSLTDVAVASLSKVRADAERFREYCRRGFTVFLALPVPAIVFVGLEAELVVRVLLGERWLAAVPMVRIMCGAAVFDSIGRLTNWLFAAEGRTREQLRWSVVSSSITVAAVIGAAPHGAEEVMWAFAIATSALALPGVAYCLRSSVLSTRDFVEAVWRPVVASIIAGGAWLLIRERAALPDAPIAGLAAGALAFVAIYATTWTALPGENVMAFLRRPSLARDASSTTSAEHSPS